MISSYSLCAWYKLVIDDAADVADAVVTLPAAEVYVCAKGLIGFTSCDIILSVSKPPPSPTSAVLAVMRKSAAREQTEITYVLSRLTVAVMHYVRNPRFHH